jgi:hypothetical protein
VEETPCKAEELGRAAIFEPHFASAAAGDLEKIRRIVRLEGYVHCGPGFRDHPKVLDGLPI